MPYNQWYSDTYESILQLSDWSNFSADVAIKMIAIFSWMPQTIMAIKHSENQLKHEIYSLSDLISTLQEVEHNFESINELSLLEIDIEPYKAKIMNIFEKLAQIMGSVAASKYLHFSIPRFFPMWDTQIRKKSRLKNDAYGYFLYMKTVINDLRIPDNMVRARLRYPANLIRGWDICCMEDR